MGGPDGKGYLGVILSHEMGHHLNCLQDEYSDSNGTECGHSIMGYEYGKNRNYCYCNEQVAGHTKCVLGAGDHGYDADSTAPVDPSTGTAWTNLASRAPFAITATPDNYDYHDFSFSGKYGLVTIH